MPLFTVPEIAKALGQSYKGPRNAVTGVSIDTRTLQKGDLFIALAGTPSGGFTSSFASAGDGHNFLTQAAHKGASCAIVSRPQPGLAIPQLVVDDTLMQGLWKLAAYARTRFNGKLIGLTGSAGKTTTKEMLAAMLGAPASVASYNNFWGVPLTLCRIPQNAAYAIVEMGMNQPGEIARLSTLARPHVALVVNVHPVHLEHLGSLDAIRREKLSIAEGLEEGGTLVIPHDLALNGTPWSGTILRFGGDADVHATGYAAQPDGSWHVTALAEGRQVEMILKDGAPHRLHNAVAALAAAYAAGANLKKAAAGLEKAGTMAGRGTLHHVAGVTMIDDSFNGNPASITAALQSLAGRPVQGRRFAILGDMLELGGDAPLYHAALAQHCKGIDGVYCVGPLMQHLYNGLPTAQRWGWAENPESLNIAAIARHLNSGDALLLKGSKKMLYAHKIPQKLIQHLTELDSIPASHV